MLQTSMGGIHEPNNVFQLLQKLRRIEKKTKQYFDSNFTAEKDNHPTIRFIRTSKVCLLPRIKLALALND